MNKKAKLLVITVLFCLCLAALLASCAEKYDLIVVEKTANPAQTEEPSPTEPQPTASASESASPGASTAVPSVTPVSPVTPTVSPTAGPSTEPTVTPHEHTFGAWTTTTAPSCTVGGEQTRVCTICGAEDKSALAPLGHSPVDIETQPATCTKPGHTGGKRCERCGEILEESREVQPTGHTPVANEDVAPTCTENGSTGGKHCSVCGAVIEEATVVKARGHQMVYEPARLPTSTKAGHTAGETCAVCKKVFDESKTIPAKGTDWILADGEYKVLLIGNSFSQDTVNFRFENEGNMLMNDLKALLGDGVKITVGICQSGSKTMAWHASQAQSGRNLYSFHIITSDDPAWRTTKSGDASSEYALKYTNWDVVSLQPYHYEAVDGMDREIEFKDETDEKFYPMSVSIPYMLDHVQKHAPQADVYCYMPWVSSSDSVLNVSLSKYQNSASYFPETLTYAGAESGKVFEDVIPVALAIQNARSTYFSLFKYHTDDSTKTQVFSYDSQFGLSRDGLHLTFNVGRYIASLTFAETVVPKALRQKNVVRPAIRVTESLGKLPDAYTELAQMCVDAALNSWKNKSLAVTRLTGYTVDPTENAASALAAVTVTVPVCGTEEALIEALAAAVAEKLQKDFVVESVRLIDSFSTLGRKAFRFECVIRFGYVFKTVAAVARME